MSFDLQEALNGAPVKLRNGNKAFIAFNLSNLKDWSKVTDRPLIGYSLNKSESLEDLHSWTLCGWSMCGGGLFDIVGMWEEPELTSEQVLEKAYEDDLLVLCDGNPDLPLKVIAKAKNGEFVMQPEDDTIQPWLANLTMEWFFVKDPAPKSNTITVTLPKPFKPKQGETYYSITPDGEGVDTLHAIRLDHGSILNGNCFRSKADAQAWQDAMKSALDD